MLYLLYNSMLAFCSSMTYYQFSSVELAGDSKFSSTPSENPEISDWRGCFLEKNACCKILSLSTH